MLDYLTTFVEVLLYVHRNRRLIRDGSPGRPPRLSHSSRALADHDDEDDHDDDDGDDDDDDGDDDDDDDDVELNVLGCRLTCNRQTVTNAYISMVQCCFTCTETVRLIRTGALDGHLDFHTAPELWSVDSVGVRLLSSELLCNYVLVEWTYATRCLCLSAYIIRQSPLVFE